MFQDSIIIPTQGRSIEEITPQVNLIVRTAKVSQGLCNIFNHHTSASLILCENADPLVRRDLEAFMQRLVPDGHPDYQHDMEGKDDMASHIRAILTTNFLTVPITHGKLNLGTWQGIYLWEHRYQPHKRRVTISIVS